MAISPARKIAFDVLRRVEAEGAYASDALHAELTSKVKSQDAALSTEIVLGVLRRRRQLDFLLERHLKKSVARLDLPVLLTLRMGLYQIRFLRGVPARAAVNESVELVKRARKSSAAPLVNAVLRRASEDHVRIEQLLPRSLLPAERLGILHSHPSWMVERWMARLGEARTIAMLEANNQSQRVACAAGDPLRRQEVFSSLERLGLRIEPGKFLSDAFSVSGGSPAQTPAFRTGQISIQDEASQAIPLLLGVQPGHRVLDLCAAPGGKTAPLFRAAGAQGLVVAADRHAHRLRAMREQFGRLGIEGIHLVELDGERRLPFGVCFDRILVDAPCTGTGTLGRHPEIRWRLEPGESRRLHQIQVSLLKSAIEQLAPGGRLIYSTCSVEREENSEVIAEVLKQNHSVRPIPGSELCRILKSRLSGKIDPETIFDEQGYFQTVPGMHPCDGFFAAGFEKA
jgi:16S rRNA (cytosine967-C5)-methyltransferase